MAMCWLDLNTPLEWAAGAAAGFVGGSAPDWLELPYGENRRVIAHRTWTHWVPLWVLAFFTLNAHWETLPMLGAPAMAFVWGALSHLLMDWPNPRGIPLIRPTARHSLNWWTSGRHDLKLVLLFWGLALFWVWRIFDRS